MVQEAEDGTLTAAGVGYYDLSPGEAFDQTFLQELIQEVERVNRPSGELKQYHLRFLRVDAPFGQSVIFADTTSEQSTLNNLVKNCILIGVLCFFAFLGISIKLAAWTVKPVEWAWPVSYTHLDVYKRQPFSLGCQYRSPLIKICIFVVFYIFHRLYYLSMLTGRKMTEILEHTIVIGTI